VLLLVVEEMKSRLAQAWVDLDKAAERMSFMVS
jgi:hypothetical protein